MQHWSIAVRRFEVYGAHKCSIGCCYRAFERELSCSCHKKEWSSIITPFGNEFRNFITSSVITNSVPCPPTKSSPAPSSPASLSPAPSSPPPSTGSESKSYKRAYRRCSDKIGYT